MWWTELNVTREHPLVVEKWVRLVGGWSGGCLDKEITRKPNFSQSLCLVCTGVSANEKLRRHNPPFSPSISRPQFSLFCSLLLSQARKWKGTTVSLSLSLLWGGGGGGARPQMKKNIEDSIHPFYLLLLAFLPYTPGRQEHEEQLFLFSLLYMPSFFLPNDKAFHKSYLSFHVVSSRFFFSPLAMCSW